MTDNTQAPIVAVRIDGKFYPASEKNGQLILEGQGHEFYEKYPGQIQSFTLHAPDPRKGGRYYVTASGERICLYQHDHPAKGHFKSPSTPGVWTPQGFYAGQGDPKYYPSLHIIGPAEWFEAGGKYHIADAGNMIGEGHGTPVNVDWRAECMKLASYIAWDIEFNRKVLCPINISKVMLTPHMRQLVSEAFDEPETRTPNHTPAVMPDTPPTGTLGELIAAHDWDSGELECKRERWANIVVFEHQDCPAKWKNFGGDFLLMPHDLLATDWTIVTPEPEKLTAEEAGLAYHKVWTDRLGKWMSAALDDPKVCDEMKADIEAMFAVESRCDMEGE